MKSALLRSAPRPVDIQLRFQLPAAHSVCLAGTFNDWNPSATPLRRQRDRAWAATLHLAPGRYEYRLVADGNWIDAPNTVESVPNPHGSKNAILDVIAPSKHATGSGTR